MHEWERQPASQRARCTASESGCLPLSLLHPALPSCCITQAESSEGMGEEETRAYVAHLVSQQLGVPGFHLDPDQVSLL